MVDCNGWTPLHYACWDDNKELAEQLMEAGADIWARYRCDKLINNKTVMDLFFANLLNSCNAWRKGKDFQQYIAISML